MGRGRAVCRERLAVDHIDAVQSTVSDPVDVERTESFVLKNLPAPTTNMGVDALAVWKAEDFSFIANYAHVRSRETADEGCH